MLLKSDQPEFTPQNHSVKALNEYKHCVGAAASFLHTLYDDFFSNPDIFPGLKMNIPNGDLYTHVLTVLQTIYRNRDDIMNFDKINKDLGKSNIFITGEGLVRGGGFTSTHIFVSKADNPRDIDYRMLLTQMGENVVLDIYSEREGEPIVAQLVI